MIGAFPLMSTSTTSRMPAPRSERGPVHIERVPAPSGTTHILSRGDWAFIVAPATVTGLVPARVESVSDDGLSASVKVTASGHFPFVRGEVYAGALDLLIVARTQVFKRGGRTKISGHVVGMTDRLATYLAAEASADTDTTEV